MSEEMDEIWQLFADDGGQSLDTVEQSLLFAKENPCGDADISALFRAMHTFKGNCRVLGLGVIESRAHRAEDLIGLVRDDGAPLDPEMLDLLFETADALRGMLEATVASRRDADEAATADLALRMRAKFERCKAEHAAGAQAHEPGGAIIFEPVSELSLAQDPIYRDIFSDLARDVLREMGQAVEAFACDPDAAQGALAKEAERLCFAAGRIGMAQWRDLLTAFLAQQAPSIEQARSAIAQIAAMLERDFGAGDCAIAEETAAAVSGPASDDPVRVFFGSLEPVLAVIAQADDRLSRGEAVAVADLDRIAPAIRAVVEPLGYARLAAAADGFALAQDDLTKFRRAKFALYEELAAIADAGGVDREDARIRPLKVLRAWCAQGAFAILLDISNALDRIKFGEDAAEPCARLRELMRWVYHACQHYELEIAADLSMALLDVFARVESGEAPADPMLLHIARSFVCDMEVVFDAANAGGRPDMAAIEKLFEKTAVAASQSASYIEARLGLPSSFCNVLSAESVKTALAAIEAGRRFYIVRTNFNQDEVLGGSFLSWVSNGAATAVSSVTVFAGDVTLFDFLLACPLDEAALAQVFATLDPAGKSLRIEEILSDREAEDAIAAASPAAARDEVDPVVAEVPEFQDTMSAGMLETIGTIVTGQAVAHHTLCELAGQDLVHTVELELRSARGDWDLAREPVSRYLATLQEKIEKLAQVELQVKSLLDRLQEEAIAVRNRPASQLLRPLASFGDTTAEQSGREVVVTTKGEETQLDFSTLENLKAPLRTLVDFSIRHSLEPPERRIAAGKDRRGQVVVGLEKQNDQVVVSVEDDGAGIDLAAIAQRARQLGWPLEEPCLNLVLRDGYGPLVGDGGGGEGTNLAEIHAALRAHGGNLSIVDRPSGGVRFLVTMPLAMAVLDGMVVRVGEVMYVLPIDAIQRIVHSDAGDLMRISAADGRYMLKLAKDDVLPIQFLLQSGPADADADPFRLAAQAATADEEDAQKYLFVVAGKATRRIALAVDELVGQQIVLIRPLQGYLSGIRGVTGCALLGSGGVGMVLDMGYVLGRP